jgi:deoxyribodipyrimidine photolyase
MNNWTILHVNYTITESDKPLKTFDEKESNIFNPGFQQDSTDNRDTAVKKFLDACNRLDSGCVQLWEKGSIIGQLYI